MSGDSLSADERVKARDLVLYEWRMLRYSSGMRLDPERPIGNAAWGSAFLDSTLLHARCLYEFLTESPGRRHVVARDFLGPKSKWKPSSVRLAKKYNPKINIYRTHVSRQRLAEEWKWEPLLPDYLEELEAAMAEFIGQLPEDERDGWRL